MACWIIAKADNVFQWVAFHTRHLLSMYSTHAQQTPPMESYPLKNICLLWQLSSKTLQPCKCYYVFLMSISCVCLFHLFVVWFDSWQVTDNISKISIILTQHCIFCLLTENQGEIYSRRKIIHQPATAPISQDFQYNNNHVENYVG